MKRLSFTLLFTVTSFLGLGSTKQPVKASQVFDYIVEVSEQEDVPFEIMLAIAYFESGLRSRDQDKYNAYVKGRGGVQGVFQLKSVAVRYVWGRSNLISKVKGSWKLNVQTAVKHLKKSYIRYKTWEKAVSVFATGSPKISRYTHKVMRKAGLGCM